MITQMKLSRVLKTPGLTSSFTSEEDSVFGESAQGIHQEGGIEGDLEIRTAVADRHRFVGLAEIRTLGCDFQKVAADLDPNRIGFLGTDQGRAVDTLEEELALELDSLVRFLRRLTCW